MASLIGFTCSIIFFFVYETGGGRRVVYGTDDGVYLSDLRDPNQHPVKVLALLDVLQVDVLEDYQLLIVLSGLLIFYINASAGAHIT